MQGNECYLTAQVLIELWVVATRLVEVNGLGWSIEQTRQVIDQLLDRCIRCVSLRTWRREVTRNERAAYEEG